MDCNIVIPVRFYQYHWLEKMVVASVGNPRLILHLSLNVIGVITVYPVLGLLWVFFRCIRLVIPPIQGILLWIATQFNAGYESVNAQYRRWLRHIASVLPL